MQKLITILAVLSILSLNGCKKDQTIAPNDKSLIKSEKGLLCRGCGSWDLSGSDVSIESTTTDSSPGTDTAFVNSKRFKDGAPVLPSKPKKK